MADEILENQTQTQDDTTQMYLEQIKELKKNSVTKEQYDKLMEENRNLLKSLVDGQAQTSTEDEKPSRSTEEILKDFNADTSNLDHIKYVMELHNKRLEEGINDFVPQGHQISPSDEDIRDAKQVEDFLNDLIETADGNADVFNNEYQRRVIDTILPRRK